MTATQQKKYLLVQNDLDPVRMHLFRHVQHVVQPPIGRCGQGASSPAATAAAPSRMKAEQLADLGRDGAGHGLAQILQQKAGPSAKSGGGGRGRSTGWEPDFNLFSAGVSQRTLALKLGELRCVA